MPFDVLLDEEASYPFPAKQTGFDGDSNGVVWDVALRRTG
jgi:hypothetical protein